MARQATGAKSKKSLPTGKSLLSGITSTLDGLAIIALFLGLGFFFGFNESARVYAVEALGFGLIPVSLWAFAFSACLRYRPRSVASHWRVWATLAGLAVVSIGVLPMFEAPSGVLFYASLGGYWGQYIGGESVPLAVVKLAAICVLLPPVLYPRRIGTAYLVCIRNLGLGLKATVNYSYIGASITLSYAWAALKLLWAGCVLAKDQAGKLLPMLARSRSETRAPGTKRDRSAIIDADKAVADFWAQAETEETPAPQPQTAAVEPAEPAEAKPVKVPKSKWAIPSIDCLSPPVAHEQAQEPLQQMARHVEASLAEHGVVVEVKDIKSGPRIVQFGLVPGWVGRRGESAKDESAKSKPDNRVKVQSILSREKDLALALKTPNLRIEAPVPGEALVGLEVPAPSPSKVHLREVMESQAFTKIASKGGLPVALGQDTGGVSVAMDLASLPHLLIAGATGSGKSVCINSIVASLLLTKPPDQLRMVMVDPKRVELTPFNKIPHLVTPVIVEVDEVNPALRAVLREMYRRYKQMEDLGTRNISGYNGKAPEPMPYFVVIVDELADLMIAGGFEVEQSLVRLAQLGRAAGIHLVLATQRPSVQVVTGLLKANIPARVAFAVASQVDSRVILDMVGAEKLLGKGDALVLNSDSPKPRRVQGTLVYDDEIDEMVRFWREQEGPPLPEIPMGDDEDEPLEDDDIDERMLEQARDMALRNPHVSSGYMARRFKVGEQRAAQIMEALEEEGLVIPR